MATYLAGFADKFDLDKLVSFKTVVKRVEPTFAAPRLPPVLTAAEVARLVSKNAEDTDAQWKRCMRDSNVDYDTVLPEPVESSASRQKRGRWRVMSQQEGQDPSEAEFDFVAVCNGHYGESSSPQLHNQTSFRGKILHSKEYRTPEPFIGRHVVVVGAGPSGTDIALELSSVAKSVWLATRNCSASDEAASLEQWNATFDGPAAPSSSSSDGSPGQLLSSEGVTAVEQPETVDSRAAAHAVAAKSSPMSRGAQSPQRRSCPVLPCSPPAAVDPSTGRLQTAAAGALLPEAIDALVWCTGYNYSFPFLSHWKPSNPTSVPETSAASEPTEIDQPLVTVYDRRIHPLYLQLFHACAPSLAFVGIPFKYVIE